MHSLIDYVAFMPNVLTDSECDNVVDWYQLNIENEFRSLIGNSNGYYEISDYRTSSTMEVPLGSEIDLILSKSINLTLQEYFNNLSLKYQLKDNQTWADRLPKKLKSENFLINRYGEGEEYKWHKDQNYNYKKHLHTALRQFSVVVYLNENFDGGETEFQFTKIKPQKGACLIFPSNFMFNHCARPVKNGVKYSCASWLAPLDEEDV